MSQHEQRRITVVVNHNGHEAGIGRIIEARIHLGENTATLQSLTVDEAVAMAAGLLNGLAEVRHV